RGATDEAVYVSERLPRPARRRMLAGKLRTELGRSRFGAIHKQLAIVADHGLLGRTIANFEAELGRGAEFELCDDFQGCSGQSRYEWVVRFHSHVAVLFVLGAQ